MKTAAYARFSSDNQKAESIEAQVDAIKAYCAKNGYTLVKIYADEALTGTNDNREQFLQMINDAKLGLFDAIVVHQLDRFARNRYDSAIYKRQLKLAGVRVYSVLEHLDDSPESIILESVLEGMAEYFSANLSRTVRVKSLTHAKNAIHMGGIPPLGYDVGPDRKLVINESEAPSVQKIFAMYIDGYGYGAIAQHLNDKGYTTKAGKPFGKNSIADILRNEKYKGEYVWNKRLSKQSGNRKYKDDSEVIRIADAVPRIVSDEVWNKAYAKLNGNKRGARHGHSRFYLLTGVMSCGECGAAYTGGSYFKGRNGDKYFVYKCTDRAAKKGCTNKDVRADLIECFVIEQIKEHCFSKVAIHRLALKLHGLLEQDNKSFTAEAKQLTTEIAELKKKINKGWELYFADEMGRAVFSEKIKELEASKKSAETRLIQIKADADMPTFSRESIKLYLHALKLDFENADTAALKKAIDTFVESVTVYYDRVEIKIRIDAGIFSINTDSRKVGGGEAAITILLSATRKDIYQR